jgi:ABC-type glycerol-3-phosphate transport system substrate-binding protein
VWPMPRGSQRANILYWSGLGIPRASRHPELAREYLQQATSVEGYQSWAGWALPARRGVALRDSLEQVFVDELPHVRPRAYQRDPRWAELAGPAMARLHEAALLHPNRPPGDLLREAATRLELERRLRP